MASGESCPACGAENATSSRFCARCGEQLGGDSHASPAQARLDPQPPTPVAEKVAHVRQRREAERRQVTVLFADMVNFTSTSEKLGEEKTFALMERIFGLMADAVREHGGSVRNFTGDGIMAVFGWPAALEDGPLRACRAALAIQERMPSLAQEINRTHGVLPALRIGLNSGSVVVGRLRDSEDLSSTVLGDTVNLAARIEAEAETGGVLMSEATHSLVEGYVELRRRARAKRQVRAAACVAPRWQQHRRDSL